EVAVSDDGSPSGEGLADRLTGLFSDALGRHRVLAALAHSAGLVVSRELSALPAGQRRDEIENGWRRYLAALARRGPLILWIDDLHLADEEGVRLFRRLTPAPALPPLIP